MSRDIFKRVSFYDGMNVEEEDLDLEQSAWVGTTANAIDLSAGSGVEKDFASQKVLFDSNDVPASVQTLIDTQNFDGDPVFPTDSFGNTIFTQPSDSLQGNQLDVEVSGASLDGAFSLRVYIFGTIFGGGFREEVLFFDKNDTKTTLKHFTSISAITTQEFFGNQNTVVDGTVSRNAGGRLRILEALPMKVARDTLMASQNREPNQDYVNYKPATNSKTLDVTLSDIATAAGESKDELGVNVTATTTRTMPANQSGVIIGQKFQATTDNIQKVSILLSVEERTLVPVGEEFDWSGDIVVGIRKLQTTTNCPTDIIPGTAIEFDPEPTSIAEVSFDQAGLEALGISLNATPQVVDFIFTQSLLSNPNIEPSVVPNDYYIITIRRSGNLSTGTVVLQEAANQSENTRLSVFSNNVWTDVVSSDLWFEVHTDAIRVSDGTAFANGRQITLAKVKENVITGVEEPFVDGDYSFVDTSEDVNNYVIVQAAESFTDPESHPATGADVFSRIQDTPDVAVVSESTLTSLITAGNEPIVLGAVKDSNPINNLEINGIQTFPGLVRESTFTVIAPNSDLLLNDVVGSVLVPNTGKPNFKYRIIKQETFTDAYGDINNDGVIDINDVVRAEAIGNIVLGDGYSENLQDGSVPSITQLGGIVGETVTMEEIIRGDVNNDGIVNISDIAAIQQNIALGTAFPAGSTFTRVVLTVEALTDPKTTTVDMLGADNAFNTVPFVDIGFRIEFVPVWTESNIEILDLRRFIPKTFTEIETTDITGTTKSGGTNTSFIPGNILLGGNVLDLDENQHPLDMEISNIIIELPDGYTAGEVDVFSNFINNTMKFSDGTLVSSSALTNNQVRVSAAIQSHVKDLGGFDFESADGYDTVDESIAILYTQNSGILRIRAGNIKNITTRPELRTKIVLTVYLKKAGFSNTDITVSSSDLSDIITAIV